MRFMDDGGEEVARMLALLRILHSCFVHDRDDRRLEKNNCTTSHNKVCFKR